MKIGLLASSALFLSACIIVVDPNDDLPPGGGADCTAPFELQTTIDFNSTLSGCYEVRRSIDIDGAVLTIEPGTVLRFSSGAWLKVVNDGAISAVGTAEKPIVFKGLVDTQGHWGGIAIATKNPANRLVHVEIANAGSDDFFWSGEAAGVVVADGRVELTDSLVRDSGGHGFHARETDNFTFARNRFESNVEAPVRIGARQIGFLDADSIYAGSEGTANGEQYVAVRGGDVTTPQTWPALDVPYRVQGADVNLTAEVTVRPGAIFEFESGRWLAVKKDGGILKAVGTSLSPIVFQGTSPVEGHWGGIAIESESTQNELTWVDVAHGGSVDWFWSGERANVVLVGTPRARLKLTHSVIRASGSHGLFAREDSSLVAFDDNVFEDNVDSPLYVPAGLLGSLDSISDYSGAATRKNGRQWITAYGGTDAAVKTNQTWRLVNVPYRFVSADVHVNAVLTIEPGVELEFASHRWLRINSENGALRAIGTQDAPIFFTGATEVPGHWGGIAILSGDVRNEIKHAAIGFAGSSEWFWSQEVANVFVAGSAALKLTWSHIHDSNGAGIVAYGTSNLIGPHPTSGEAYNSFAGNKSGNFVSL